MDVISSKADLQGIGSAGFQTETLLNPASSRCRPLLVSMGRHSHAGERLRVGQRFRQGRLYTIKQANWSAISERDVHDIAVIFIREHGPSAARQAGEWADLMFDRGDRIGHATWRRILWAIEETRHRGLRRTENLPPADRPDLHVPRLYSDIDKSLERVIRAALSAARDRGQDGLAQTEQALHAAQQARPKLSVADALSAVEMARRK